MVFNVTKDTKKSENYNIDITELQGRRIDSIAWLAQGDAKCGAACFNGEKLLLAANNKYSLARPVKTFLTNVATIANGLRRPNLTKEGIFEIKKQITKEVDTFYEEWYKACEKFERETRRESILSPNDRDGRYWDRSDIAINKIIDSIIATAVNPSSEQAIPRKLFEALLDKQIEIVENKEEVEDKYTNDIHAEMQILQRLMKSLVSSGTNNKPYYIGISKRCCIKCEAMMDSVKEVIGDKIKIRPKLSAKSEHYIFKGHGNAFSSTGIPNFFLYDESNPPPLDKQTLYNLRNTFIDRINYYSVNGERWKKVKPTLPDICWVFDSMDNTALKAPNYKNPIGQHYSPSTSPERTHSSNSSSSTSTSSLEQTSISMFDSLNQWVSQGMQKNWSTQRKVEEEKTAASSSMPSSSSSKSDEKTVARTIGMQAAASTPPPTSINTNVSTVSSSSTSSTSRSGSQSTPVYHTPASTQPKYEATYIPSSSNPSSMSSSPSISTRSRRIETLSYSSISSRSSAPLQQPAPPAPSSSSSTVVVSGFSSSDSARVSAISASSSPLISSISDSSPASQSNASLPNKPPTTQKRR